jgi:asparagine N-glycosylation enzyme membrane subunit Stt3
MGIIIKKYKIMEPKRKNWTVPVVIAASFLALAFFFFIDSDAVRHDAETGKLWEVLAGVFFGLFILTWVVGYILQNRKND